jgi:hypothetical protein
MHVIALQQANHYVHLSSEKEVRRDLRAFVATLEGERSNEELELGGVSNISDGNDRR